VWDIVRKHEEQAHALIQKHATQRVQTDETGHYVVVKVPTGKAYVYARWREAKADFSFVSTSKAGPKARLQTTARWPFVP
jgi:hypothetical protein